MMDESGRGEVDSCGDYHLFAQARRLALPFMCMTNCYDYIYTLLTEIRLHFLDSDRDRLQLEGVVFCARTANNRPIHRDTFVEKLVGLLRRLFGKM